MDLNYKVFKILIKNYGTEKLLAALFDNSERSETAWEEFLRRYSRLILKVCWKYEKDYDKVMQRYVYACERLIDNDFHLLKKYNTDFMDRTPKFSNWLIAVVRNICVDYYRKLNGRKRYPAAVAQLSDEDKMFFKLYYWKGLSLTEIGETMNLSSLSSGENAGEKLERINSHLLRTPKRENDVEFVAFDDEIYYTAGDNETDNYDDKINEWISKLSPVEKIAVRLRFWDGLTAREISEVLQIKPYNKVYSILNTALRILRSKSENDGNL